MIFFIAGTLQKNMFFVIPIPFRTYTKHFRRFLTSFWSSAEQRWFRENQRWTALKQRWSALVFLTHSETALISAEIFEISETALFCSGTSTREVPFLPALEYISVFQRRGNIDPRKKIRILSWKFFREFRFWSFLSHHEELVKSYLADKIEPIQFFWKCSRFWKNSLFQLRHSDMIIYRAKAAKLSVPKLPKELRIGNYVVS